MGDISNIFPPSTTEPEAEIFPSPILCKIRSYSDRVLNTIKEKNYENPKPTLEYTYGLAVENLFKVKVPLTKSLSLLVVALNES